MNFDSSVSEVIDQNMIGCLFLASLIGFGNHSVFKWGLNFLLYAYLSIFASKFVSQCIMKK